MKWLQGEVGQVEGKRQATAPCCGLSGPGLVAVIALHEDAAREVASGGHAVDPGDGVFASGVRGGERDEFVDADELVPLYSILRETMGRSLISAQVMRPVSPMPPMVAANQSAFCGADCK